MIRFFWFYKHICVENFTSSLKAIITKKNIKVLTEKKASTSSANISIPRRVRKCKLESSFIFRIKILT